jgi:hypothetical protein
MASADEGGVGSAKSNFLRLSNSLVVDPVAGLGASSLHRLGKRFAWQDSLPSVLPGKRPQRDGQG